MSLFTTAKLAFRIAVSVAQPIDTALIDKDVIGFSPFRLASARFAFQ